ncbi:hypothetical protein NHX12_029997 [Muraenolepis orangiensis]|uniref:Uncharacterized protein n=1 Tax=Muraenolepis orangiensis TaxID=630683 RepID=A0A9Q0EAW7_9TELE|nr:hypothetical protein NHX12_029997 [Muraenolepis orangiensis]
MEVASPNRFLHNPAIPCSPMLNVEDRKEAEEGGRGRRQRKEAEEGGRGRRQRKEAEEGGRGRRLMCCEDTWRTSVLLNVGRSGYFWKLDSRADRSDDGSASGETAGSPRLSQSAAPLAEFQQKKKKRFSSISEENSEIVLEGRHRMDATRAPDGLLILTKGATGCVESDCSKWNVLEAELIVTHQKERVCKGLIGKNPLTAFTWVT